MKLTTKQYEDMNEALKTAYDNAMLANEGHIKGASDTKEFAFYDGLAQTLYILGLTLYAETATSCLQLSPENVA